MSAEAAVKKTENAPLTASQKMANIVSLAKRRGFVFPASEIYGGLNGFWDFGPLGAQLKNNIRDAWWHDMVECPPVGPDDKLVSIVGLDSAIIQNPQTWVASGHVGGFADLMTDCRESKNRYRADHLLCFPLLATKTGQSLWLAVMDGEDAGEKAATKAKKLGGKRQEKMDLGGIAEAKPFTQLSPAERDAAIGPDTDNPGTLTEPRAFNLMFNTYVGVFQSEDSKAYLRPETAQGIFLNYKNVLDTSRVKVPFGIAQVGKAFRNEVTPRNFIFRTREFEQMEMEFFCQAESAKEWYEFWVTTRLAWWHERIGLNKNLLQRREHDKDELAHYSTSCADVEYKYPFTEPKFGELEGIAHRGNYDLTQHQTHAKTNLEYFDQEDGNKRYLPHVIEPASGLTRGVLAVLCNSYEYDESRASPEWLRIKPSLAPTKVGVFPLVNKDGMPEMAEKLYLDLRQDMTAQYDPKQTIGKRYARMDEAGTPFCITVDGDSLKDQTVTVRHRDTAQQERVASAQLKNYLAEKLK
jgi:glycyl-tRNA synthetase